MTMTDTPMVPHAALMQVVAWLLEDRHCPPPWEPQTCPREATSDECAECIAKAAIAAAEEAQVACETP